MVAIILIAARLDQPNNSYAELPVLATTQLGSTALQYKILSENVAINLVSGDRVRIASTTVYRNIGAAGTARIFVTSGLLGTKGPLGKVLATWDNVPITFAYPTATAGTVGNTAYATVPLGKDATHALRMNVFGTLAQSGYAKDEFSFRYKLTGNVPIALFSLAYRYPSGSIFGLPKVEPDLGWEIGSKGASIRKTDFVPNDAETKILFYKNAMDPLGTKG
jgi:hypothetical protein